MIVVLQKHKTVGYLCSGFQASYFLQNEFRALVLGVSLSGKHKLDRAIAIVNNLKESLGIFQQQIPALVAGDPPRKTNRQSARFKHISRRFSVPLRLAATYARRKRPL